LSNKMQIFVYKVIDNGNEMCYLVFGYKVDNNL